MANEKPITVRSCSYDCDFVTTLRARVVELEGEVERVRAFCEVEVVAALRLQLEQSKAEVERLTKERDAAETQIADCERWKAQAGIEKARATAAEAELAMLMESTDGVRQAVGRWQERAREAESREAGLKAALNMMDECCWQAWKAFTEEGPNAAEKFLHDVCITEGIMNNDGGRIPRVALAAPKEVKP